MKIECSPKELRELINKETSVAGTTDVSIELDGKEIARALVEYQN